MVKQPRKKRTVVGRSTPSPHLNWHIARPVGAFLLGLAVQMTDWNPFRAALPYMWFGIFGYATAEFLSVKAINEKLSKWKQRGGKLFYAAALLVSIIIGLSFWYVAVALAKSNIEARPRGFIDPQFKFRQAKLAPEAPLELEVHYVNAGGEPIHGVYYFGALELDAPDRPQIEDFRKLRDEHYALQIKNRYPGRSIRPGLDVWQPITLEMLLKNEYEALKKGSTRLYVYSWATWHGADRDVEVCVALIPPTDDVVSNVKRLTWQNCE
jgi:hypothetical protein